MTSSPLKNKVHPSIKEHLRRQGFTTEQDIQQFLFPMLADLPSPFLMKDMERAAELIAEAIREQAQIIIWGDYDVDGITATALLLLFFEKLNIAVDHHIPNRLREGYGLNKKTLSEIAERNDRRKLLITVDCGISNHEEIAHAQGLGFTVIVSDHHQPPEKEVTADAILNPKQRSCDFPCEELSGVGVAFYLAAAIRSKLRTKKCKISDSCEPNMKSFMCLVMLGTIADLVPLTGINRILVRAGMESLVHDPIDGVVALLETLNISKDNLNAETIAFQVAPVINAAGRLGDPDIALKTLTCTGSEAKRFARNLVTLNNKRKQIGSEDLEAARSLCRSMTTEGLKALVLKGPFHEGLLGITASRLVEEYNLPALVCSSNQKNLYLKGSGRAPENFDLFSVLYSCSRFLDKFGGHRAAAGFTIKADHFAAFAKAFNDSAALEIFNKQHNNSILVDKMLTLPVSEAFNPELLDNLVQLEPLGEGNPKPLFVDADVRFVSKKNFGKNGEHIRGMLRGKFQNIPFIGFNVGRHVTDYHDNGGLSIAYCHMLDTYNNGVSWKLRIEKFLS